MHHPCNVECSACGTRWPTHTTFLTLITSQFSFDKWFGWCTLCGKSRKVRLMHQGEKLDGAIKMPHMDFGLTIQP